MNEQVNAPSSEYELDDADTSNASLLEDSDEVLTEDSGMMECLTPILEAETVDSGGDRLSLETIGPEATHNPGLSSVWDSDRGNPVTAQCADLPACPSSEPHIQTGTPNVVTCTEL